MYPSADSVRVLLCARAPANSDSRHWVDHVWDHRALGRTAALRAWFCQHQPLLQRCLDSLHPSTAAGYDPECNIQDTTTIDGSFNVPKFLETLPGLSTNFPVKSMLFNPWWCYKDSGNPLTLG